MLIHLLMLKEEGVVMDYRMINELNAERIRKGIKIKSVAALQA